MFPDDTTERQHGLRRESSDVVLLKPNRTFRKNQGNFSPLTYSRAKYGVQPVRGYGSFSVLSSTYILILPPPPPLTNTFYVKFIFKKQIFTFDYALPFGLYW